MTIVMIGIDLGKNSCSVAALDESGAVVLRRRMRPASIVEFAAKHAPCTVAMEACCGAHYMGRRLLAQGHAVKLMPPEYVRPYVKAQKNDDRDAEAIAEAATRPTMRFVEVKSQEQLDVQSLHRVRSRLVGVRTALINQMRAVLLERGIVVAQGRRKFEKALDEMFADDALFCPGRLRDLLLDMRAEWSALDRRIGALDQEFVQLARTDEVARPNFDPWGWRSQRDGAGGRGWQRRGVRPGAGSWCLARARSTAAHNGRQAAAAGDQQAREHLSPDSTDPRRQSRATQPGESRYGTGRMAARAPGPVSSQHRGGGPRQQTGEDRMGNHAAEEF